MSVDRDSIDELLSSLAHKEKAGAEEAPEPRAEDTGGA
jgi:hypothetical protein